jgi:hypothetical protein
VVAKRVIDEIKEGWRALPPFAQFTIGGSVLGAVGYLFHWSGIGRMMPPGLHYRPPFPRYDDWQQRDHRHGTYHGSGHEHTTHAHGREHSYGSGHRDR